MKAVTSQRPRNFTTQSEEGNTDDYANWQKSKLLSKIGNQNLQYAKRQKANPDADIFNDNELRRVETETGLRKQDQLALLNRKVK